MSLLETARYDGPLEFIRFLPLNADLTQPSPTNIMGGIGPFDFSGAALPAAVTIKWKIDDGTEQTDDLDISGASDTSAVTVTELVSAFTTASPTGLTASKDATTNRFKVVMTTPGTTEYFQFYGEVAEFSDIGQGYGVKFIKSDTMQSDAPSVNRKDDETLTITDAQGRDVEVIRPGYRKSVAHVLTDTAKDFSLAAMILGVDYDGTTFEVPTSANDKTRFNMEIFYPEYQQGTQDEADKVGYTKLFVRYCQGNVDQPTLENAIAPWVYNITGTQQTVSGTIYSDSSYTALTVEEYEALDVENV